jgi:GNAT superfamily N-acetyltransferase
LSASDFHIEPISGDHDRTAFSCEAAPLVRYLKEQAGKEARKNIATTFVLLADDNRIAGYYTLSSTNIPGDDLPPGLVKKLRLPPYPQLPATLLGARNSAFRGQDIGELLLLDALKRAYTLSKQIASLAVVVDAKHERAVRFYKDFRADHRGSGGRESTEFKVFARVRARAGAL